MFVAKKTFQVFFSKEKSIIRFRLEILLTIFFIVFAIISLLLNDNNTIIKSELLHLSFSRVYSNQI